MARYTITLLVAGVLLIALAAVGWLVPVPYVAMSPGPTEDVLGTVDGADAIEIDGPQTYPTTGQLDLTTVAVTRPDQRLDLLSAVREWLNPDVAVVPRSYLYPDDSTPQEIQEHNVLQMETSQHDAIAAALRRSGEEVPVAVLIHEIIEDTPAAEELELGDVLVAVDGERVTDAEQAVELISDREPGDRVRLQVTRDGEPTDIALRTEGSSDDPDRAIVGFYPRQGYDFPFEVTINVHEDIGGPSAGLMFAVAISDLLSPGSLTGGQHIAGTGTIDSDGNVGEIGGVEQKVVAAREKEADAFLTPAGNCDAALAADSGDVELLEVATLDDAVEALQVLSGDREGELARCGE